MVCVCLCVCVCGGGVCLFVCVSVCVSHLHVLFVPDEEPGDIAGESEWVDDVEDGRQDGEEHVDGTILCPTTYQRHPVWQPGCLQYM